MNNMSIIDNSVYLDMTIMVNAMIQADDAHIKTLGFRYKDIKKRHVIECSSCGDKGKEGTRGEHCTACNIEGILYGGKYIKKERKITQWVSVSRWLYKKLEGLEETVLDAGGQYLWGREKERIAMSDEEVILKISKV